MYQKKRCPSCDCDLELDAFAWKNRVKGIRQVWCKQCLKKANSIHYLENTQNYKKRAIERNQRLRTENKRGILAYLTDHPCVDCGNKDIRVLDFDHVYGKKVENISRMIQNSPWEIIEAEIAKCEVRCANCHRIKTIERGQWWRFDLAEEAARFER